MYIVVEGKDLVGKSTFIKKLVKAYEVIGKEIVQVTEPFMGHPTGQKIRDFLKEKHTNSDDLYKLYKENREYLWKSVIRPALESGKIVISDRNFISSMVYQVNMGMMSVLGHNTDNHPDIVYYLSISHDTYLERLKKKKNLEVIELEFVNKAKSDECDRRYKEACSILERTSKTLVIPVKSM